MIISHPNRTQTQIRPLKALRHFRALIADKEDTEQVFHIIDNLRTKRYLRNTVAYLKSDQGKMLIKRGENLPAILDDHDRLKRLPAGSLGRAYAEFMETEGLTAQGLVEENAKFESKIPEYNDQIKWFNDRMRDTHDMAHILTGYGRDPLGEQCVLAFSYAQNYSLGLYFIAYAGGLEVKRCAPAKTPVFSAIREAQRGGKKAAFIGFQDIVALLPQPLDKVRQKLGIISPLAYQKALKIYEKAGISPHDGLIVTA